MKHYRTRQYEFVNEVLMISVAELVDLDAADLSLLAVEEALDRGTLMGLLPSPLAVEEALDRGTLMELLPSPLAVEEALDRGTLMELLP
jgi:hypothetical protein